MMGSGGGVGGMKSVTASLPPPALLSPTTGGPSLSFSPTPGRSSLSFSPTLGRSSLPFSPTPGGSSLSDRGLLCPSVGSAG